jgi:hypothetical protein
MHRDGSVDIANRYGLDGQGIKSQQGEIFRTGLSWPWFPPRLLYNGHRVGIKRPGRGADHPSSSSAEVKERTELYLYSPSGPSWSVLRWSLYLIERCHADCIFARDLTLPDDGGWRVSVISWYVWTKTTHRCSSEGSNPHRNLHENCTHPIYRAFHNILLDYNNLLHENRRTRIHETCTNRRKN